MALILSGFILGLMGSFHCAGMCGPLVIVMPLNGRTGFLKVLAGIIYNLGRTSTYALFGAFFGLVGQGFTEVGFQQWISIVMGTLMILSIIFPKLFANKKHFEKGLFSFVSQLKQGIRKLFTKKSYGALFFMGFLNGLLPCGLVYIAVAGALGTSNVISGTLFMILFGLGTIPMMLGISLLGNMASVKIRNKITKFIPVVVVFVGLLFILRGLNLGIPFVSPKSEMIDKRFKMELLKKDSKITNDTIKESDLPKCH